MKILIAADGSIYTKRLLAYVAAHDEWLGGRHEYTVLHCVPEVEARAEASVGADVVRRFYEEEAEAVFRPIRAFFTQQGIAATFMPEVGDSSDTIARLAEEGKVDLLAMGSHGHGWLAGVVLGSVATKVLAKCSTPVLLVR